MIDEKESEGNKHIMDTTGSVDTKNPDETNEVVNNIYQNLFNSSLFDKVEHTLDDVVSLFNGEYPGYQKCDTPYHDLEHTLQAYLATARIFDGLLRENHTTITEEWFALGLISALGHDTGYVKENWDIQGTGAKYTLSHVNRSKEFMGKYLPSLGFNSFQIEGVQNIISCTGLGVTISSVPFSSDNERRTAFIVGTADYLGQMSDPNYLQKLPNLYQEFKDGGVTGYQSAQDLITKTPTFFDQFVMKRFTEDFQSVYLYAANHFGGKNLYIEGINRNINKINESYIIS
jgi:hypothetical protein